jgi:hypothetical protein
MKFFKLIPYYFSWHYTYALADFISAWNNYLWFVSNYFSIGFLIRNLLKPFRQLSENKTLDKVNSELKIVTFLMIFFGLLIRIATITAGIFAWFIVLLTGLISFFAWLILPFLMIIMFLVSFGALFLKGI